MLGMEKKLFELFRDNLPDLVLMDIKMPILNGYESFQKIRELSEMYR